MEQVSCSLCLKQFLQPLGQSGELIASDVSKNFNELKKDEMSSLSWKSEHETKGNTEGSDDFFVHIDTNPPPSNLKKYYLTENWEGHYNEKYKFEMRLQEVLKEPSSYSLCYDCLRHLMVHIDAQTEFLENQSQVYSRAAKILKEEATDLDSSSLDSDLLKFADEETKLMNEMNHLLNDWKNVLEEKTRLSEKKKTLQLATERYWNEYNAFILESKELCDEEEKLDQKCRALEKEIQVCKSTNVYQDVFEIDCDRAIATINGCRLGMLPQEPVGWEEVNAALGRAALLLAQVIEFSKKMQSKRFQSSYRIYAKGSTSGIKKKEINNRDSKKTKNTDSKIYPLYYDGGSKFAFIYSTFGFEDDFDKALVLFLQCLKEFCDFLFDAVDFQVSYQIERDQLLKLNNGVIESFSIKYHPNSLEKWTMAWKLTLTNLKDLLRWFEQFNKQGHS
jgi:beclin 1